MIVLDTSALLRYLTNDDTRKADLVERLLFSNEEILIVDGVLVELQYLLIKSYKSSREFVVESFQTLLSRSNVKSSLETRTAVQIFGQTSFSFVDCLTLAYSAETRLASFDRDLIKFSGVRAYFKNG